MFEIRRDIVGKVQLQGRFDASQIDKAEQFFGQIEDSCVVDFSKLEYISSAGIGLLMSTHKRLVDHGSALKLINLNPHIREVFEIAGFNYIFDLGLED